MRTTVRSEKALCTGCGACAVICPKGAITMLDDAEGFAYPVVDSALCVECNLCEKRCPAGKPVAENRPKAYGATHRDENVRAMSSSGGVFTALAEHMLSEGGAVFGAAFDEEFGVEHIGAVERGELSALRGSKYVQSDATEAIGHAAALLERGMPVLFTGTPCQIAGLLARVPEKHREKLVTMDIVCHGVASPGVFADYLKKVEAEQGAKVVAYTFRDKRKGWKDFCAVARFADGTERVGDQRTEPYLYGFLQNLYLRPSCTQCDGWRMGHHPADITIADYWGAEKVCPDRDDDKGLSLLFANSQKGRKLLDACAKDLMLFPAAIGEEVLRANPCIVRPAEAHRNRERFFRYYAGEGFNASRVMKLLAPPGKMEQLGARIAHLPAGLKRRIGVLLEKR